MFALADRLHKTPAEIRAMPHRDLVGLVEYYNIAAMWADLKARASRMGR